MQDTSKPLAQKRSWKDRPIGAIEFIAWLLVFSVVFMTLVKRLWM